MIIILNGQKKQVSDMITLQKLIDSLDRNSAHIIAEVNEAIIKSAFWESTPLKKGDRVELVTFVGGG